MADADYRSHNMKDLPAEFFLPPQSTKALRDETIKLIALCFAFVLILAVPVVLTNGIVISI